MRRCLDPRPDGDDFQRQAFERYVCCARAIEEHIFRNGNPADGSLPPKSAEKLMTLNGYGTVSFVLAHSVREGYPASHVRADILAWSKGIPSAIRNGYERYFQVDTALAYLETFIDQARQEIKELGLFDLSQCDSGAIDECWEGKILVLSPNSIPGDIWEPERQLWWAEFGPGCDPETPKKSIFATRLSDGKDARWRSADFYGVLDEQYLPEWAKPRLEEFRSPQHEQETGPVLSGMEIR